MCVHAQSAARVARCTASKNQCHKGFWQERSRCDPRRVRSRLPPPPIELRAVDAVAQLAPSLRGTLSDSIRTAEWGGCAFATCSLEPPKLWIHIQDVTHKSRAVAVIRSLATLMLDGAAISPQSVRVVPDGPLVDEIRCFKAGDRPGALAIIRALKRVLPRLWLRDLSAEYDQVAWIGHGHYELWLAPGDEVKDH
jgi:hypothetical protein